jgi:hypothetical protein
MTTRLLVRKPVHARRLVWGRCAAVCFFILSTFTLGSNASAQDATNDEVRIRIELDRDRVVAEKHRWERLVETQQALGRDPSRLARATEDAARDLSANGRSLVVEGITGGLSNFLKLQKEYAKAAGDSTTEQQLKTVDTVLTSAHTLVIKDLVLPPPKEWKPSAATNDAIAKLNAALKLVILMQVKDPQIAAGMSASLDLSKSMTGFLSAYLTDDKVTLKQVLPAVQGLLSGTLAMTKALARTSSKMELEGAAAAIAQQLPAFAPVAKMMATTAITDFNISLALANIGWGGYAMANGFALEAQAEEIRYNQGQAAATLGKLLPRARAEIARAEAAEQQLTDALAALGPAPPHFPPVQASARFLDDAPRYTLAPASLPVTVAAIRETPSLTITLTMRELDRRVDRQHTLTEQELEAARATARAEARRAAAEQRRWAERADVENDRRDARPTRSVPSERSSNMAGLERARRVVESAKNVTLP